MSAIAFALTEGGPFIAFVPCVVRKHLMSRGRWRCPPIFALSLELSGREPVEDHRGAHFVLGGDARLAGAGYVGVG
jgi:hypothetical protein